MKKFKPFIDGKHPNFPDGWQKVYKFENGLGASVICTSFSYGASAGFMELAVIKFLSEDTWSLVYDTGITNDVIGYLSQKEVNSYLSRIESLPKDYEKHDDGRGIV